jgi:hypothetical protein
MTIDDSNSSFNSVKLRNLNLTWNRARIYIFNKVNTYFIEVEEKMSELSIIKGSCLCGAVKISTTSINSI